MRRLIIATLILTSLLPAACGGKQVDPVTAKRADLHYKVGIDALSRGQLPRAFEELLLADEIRPDHAETLSALGYAWRLRSELKKSEQSYKRALRASPSSSIYNNYGSLLLQMNKPKLAEKQFRLALEDPRYRSQDMVYLNLGDALLAQDKFNDAVAAYRQATLINPNQKTLAMLKEANAYLKFNRLHYARTMYETIFSEQPQNRAALEGLVDVLKRQKNFTKARQHLKTYRSKATDPLDKAWASDELEGINSHD